MNPSYKKFKDGLPLTRKEAMKAQCYECNGYSVEKVDDCLGFSCPLYQWSPWGKYHISEIFKHSYSTDKKRIRKNQASFTEAIG